MSKKRILIATAVFPPEPVVTASLMRDLATELSKDYDVTVICPHPTRPMGFKMVNDRQQKEYPFKIVEVDSYTCPESKMLGRWKESYSFGAKVREYIAQQHGDIDIIHQVGWPLACGFLISKVAKKYNIPYTTSVQDIYPEALLAHINNKILQKLAFKLLLPLSKYILQNASKIHTISDINVELLSKTRNIPKNSLLAVKNWQNEEEFIDWHKNAVIYENPEHVLTFMYVGNVGPLAGLEIVIEAFKQTGLKNARLIIAGAGSEKISLINYVKNNNITNVEFWDVPEGKVPEIQSNADVMILPMKKGFAYSSIPSKLPAYMLSKKPVLASVDAGSETANCIIESGGGWVVEPENIDEISNVMQRISKYQMEDLTILGEKAFEYAMKFCSKSSNLQQLSQMIRNIIS